MGKNKKYAAPNDEESQVRIKKDTQPIIMAVVDSIGVPPVLSDEWLVLATQIEKLAKISSIQECKSGTEQEKTYGRNIQGTLWDSQREVLSLKVIVEKKKIHQLVLLIKNLKEWQRMAQSGQQKRNCAGRHGKELQDIQNKILQFEVDIGFLLYRLYDYPESFLASDLAILMVHITQVLMHSNNIEINHQFSQEIMVWRYIGQMFRKFQQIDSENVVRLSQEYQIAKLAAQNFLLQFGRYSNGVKQIMLEAMGALADCVRDMQEEIVEEQEIVESNEQKMILIDMRQNAIRDVILEFPDRRPLVSPFIDLIDQFEREIRFPKKGKK